MSTTPAPVAGHAGDQSKQSNSGIEQRTGGGRRPRGSKNSAATMPLDFTGQEDLLNNIKALAQLMDFNVNKYMIEAIAAKFKADRERVKKDFSTKKQ